MFRMWHHSSAVVMYVEYECDSTDITVVSAKAYKAELPPRISQNVDAAG